MEFKDYYKTMGVERAATAEEIKRAYRRLARKYHPDVSKEEDAEARFKEMKEAYEVLKDPEKRAAYDQFGANWKAGQDFHPPPDWQSASSFDTDGARGSGEFSDFFDSLFGGHEVHRGGSSRQNREFRIDGEDVNARINVSVDDAYRGTTRQISLEIPELGQDGRLSRKLRTLNVRVPKGITSGQRIRLENQGSPGFGSGARSGNLYLQVEIDPHPIYRVQGRDVHVTLPIAPWEAALGATVKAPTLAGAVDLKIPAASNTGKRLRLKGRGLPGEPAGDEYIELEITMPQATSSKEQALYEQLKQEQSFNPRAALGV